MLSKLGRCGESSDRHAVCRTDQAILAFACAASAAFPIERPVEQGGLVVVPAAAALRNKLCFEAP